jgi:hypothetical protein
MSDQERLASRFRRLVELREKRDEDKTSAEKSEVEYREYEAELFEELSDGPMQGTLRFDLGGNIGIVTFTPRETKFGRIVDADAAVQYFEERELAKEFTKPAIEKRKLNELVRDLLEQGKSMPAGIDWYAKRGITISRKS